MKKLLVIPLLFLGTFVMNGQTTVQASVGTDSKEVQCKPANCDPAKCQAMVAAGLCTEEEAKACAQKCSSTKVASVRLERSNVPSESASAQKVSTVQKQSCQKVCTSKKDHSNKKT